MTGASGHGEAATHLLSLAGPDMYVRNAFRVTELAADVDGRTIRERRQRLTTMAAAGDEAAKAALAAFDDLRDDRHRIVHELLWYWENDPEQTCHCPRSLHVAHNLAVRSHAKALELERQGQTRSADQAWGEAVQKWREVLRRAAVWDHVRHRIDRLGDRRLTQSTVDEIRDVLPRALAKPIVDLAAAAESPARLVKRAAGWDFGAHVVSELLTDATDSLVTAIDAALRQAGADLDAGKPGKAARALLKNAVPKVKRLDLFLPHGEHRATARTRDEIAILLNNCALAVTEHPTRSDISVQQLYDTALALVVAPDQREVIAGNAATERRREEIDKDLAEFGLSVANDGLARLSERLSASIRAGRFTEAQRILTVLRKHATDTDERRLIDQMLDQLRSATLIGGGIDPISLLGPRPVPRPSVPPPWQAPARQRRGPGRLLRFVLACWPLPIGVGGVGGTAAGVWTAIGYVVVVVIAFLVSAQLNRPRRRW